jgi:hypothetical protein
VKRPVEPQNPRILLESDHAAIDEMLCELADQVRAEDRTIAPATWERLETALLAHMNVEEMFVIPLLAAEDPQGAEGLLRTHADLRRSLGELGLAFELHTIRADAVDDFCKRLRMHAAVEGELLYPFAERRLPVSTVRSLLGRLRTVARPSRRPATTSPS